MPPLPPKRLLTDCPQWPSVHTLPSSVVARLEQARWRLHASGRTARTQDIVGMLIMLQAPTTGRALVRLLVTPHPALRTTVARLPTGQASGVMRTNERRLWMELPSPVSHRLNALVDLAHGERFRTTRRQLVSALVLHRLSSNVATLGADFDRYRGQQARHARIASFPLTRMLDTVPPKPGRRPM